MLMSTKTQLNAITLQSNYNQQTSLLNTRKKITPPTGLATISSDVWVKTENSHVEMNAALNNYTMEKKE
jgi:hypothetical protein